MYCENAFLQSSRWRGGRVSGTTLSLDARPLGQRLFIYPKNLFALYLATSYGGILRAMAQINLAPETQFAAAARRRRRPEARRDCR